MINKNVFVQQVVFATISLVVFFTVSCSDNRPKLKGHDFREIQFFSQCQQYDFQLIDLENNRRPNRNFSLTALADTTYVQDSSGIWMFERDGKKYYHPVGMVHRAVPFISAYDSTGEEKYLQKAKLYADKFLSIADRYDSAIYFPYQFDYYVHSDKKNYLKPPWYSGMAQGEILSFFVRLYQSTDDTLYLHFSDSIFNSFLRLKDDTTPWTVFVDERGCYWIEEYPTEVPSMTLNGFVFAIYGLYDYYELTKSKESERLLKESINTIKNYIPYFRRDSQVSFYNLTFRHYSSTYHYVHIEQLQMLSKMTGDIYFSQMADSLVMDFNKEKEPLFR